MQQHHDRTDRSHRWTPARVLRRALGVLVVTAATAGVVLTITSAPGSGRDFAAAGVPRPSATPSVDPGPDRTATFFEDFDTPATAGGQFQRTYANAWQPYAEGTSGKYFSDKLISAHDGVMDVAMDGEHGAAGVFGPPDSAWAHVGGTYSIRARVVGGVGNGAAIMLWPTSNVRSEGEINFPEGNFESHPVVYHHSMVPGHEGSAQGIDSDVTWRKWHTYTIDWKPGKSVSYFVDGRLLGTITTNVPTTAHRYTFQIGDTGAPGHVLIDWVSRNDAD